MVTTTISYFRKNIKGYIDSVIENNEPVLINRGQQGAVLVSLDEYNAMARTASVLTSQTGTDVLEAAKKQEFIEVSIDANSKPDYREGLEKELKALRESELWRTGAAVRKLRPEEIDR